MSPNIAAILLGVFFATIGVTHFLLPDYYVRLVPNWIPHERILVLLTGAAEILIGGLLLLPASREADAWTAAALIVLYLVSHVDALARSRGVSWKDPLFGLPGAVLRLVVNLFYVVWAVWVATSVG